MKYVESILTGNEQIVYTGKVSVWRFVPAVIVISVFSVFLLMLPAVLWVFLIIKTTELAITTKRVISKFGFISRKTFELNLAKIESVSVDQPFMGRLFNYGTINIIGTGGAVTPIPSIHDPITFKARLNQAHEKALYEASRPGRPRSRSSQEQAAGTTAREKPLGHAELFDIGRKHLRNNQYDAAARAFTAAIRIKPMAEYYFARAVAYKKSGDTQLVKPDLREAARLGHPKAKKFLEHHGG